MKHFFFSIAILLALFTKATTQNDAYFSILTCSPGTDIHAHFGHTAIRYVDPEKDIDIVYNYGIFSYSDDFAYNFVQGNTYYQLGIQNFSRFMNEYMFDNRAIIEQKLQLSPTQKQRLLHSLHTNYLPENRYYLYNFFYDNCASRPRDILIAILGDSLVWNTPQNNGNVNSFWFGSTREALQSIDNLSWRTLIHIYVSDYSWLRFGISLGLGLPADKTLTHFESMFLPDCLFLQLESASISQNDSLQPLISQTSVLCEQSIDEKKQSPTSPATILWWVALMFIAIAAIEWYKRTHLFVLDTLIYFIIGLSGIFVWYVSFFSIHPAVFPNINIIWASPLHILFGILWIIPLLRKYIVWYIYMYIVICIVYIISAPINPQYVHSGYIAIVTIILSRSIGFALFTKRKNDSKKRT